jgi:hypothetical protein
MNAQEILDQVYRLDAKLIVIDGKMKASPPGVLPPELKAAIRERATDIKALLPAEPLIIERSRWAAHPRPPMPLRRCGALVCRTCHVLSLPRIARVAPSRASSLVVRDGFGYRRTAQLSAWRAQLRPTCP